MYGAMPLLSFPRRFAARLWPEDIQVEAPPPGILRPPCSLHLVTAIHGGGSANALRTTTSHEQAFAAGAKLVVDLGIGYFGTGGCWKSHVSRPRRPAALLRVGRIEDEAASARILRPRCSVLPFTAIRKFGSANALRTTTPHEQASAARTKLVVDVGMGYSRAHDCWGACSPAWRGDLRSYGAMPHLSRPLLSCPPL